MNVLYFNFNYELCNLLNFIILNFTKFTKSSCPNTNYLQSNYQINNQRTAVEHPKNPLHFIVFPVLSYEPHHCY
jgi:hypothetical protein